MSSLSRIVVCILFCWVVSGASTQTPPAPGCDVTVLVDKIFDKWNRTDSPGCALSVMQDGHIIYTHGYGMANLDHNVTITPATVFHVASMSKQFTAASIIFLEQQGKLSLDDDVRTYIPELPDFGSQITIRQLIHHTSGLRDQWELLELAGWRYSLDLITDEDVLSVVTRQNDLNFTPGEKHVYCNTGYTLLAIIVKRVSGLTFREFTTKNIFEPLGMTNTHFRDDHAEIVKNNAYGYEQDKAGVFRLSLTNFDTTGATSLHTTAEDLALWDENFYNPRVGGASFPEQMVQRGRLNNGEILHYASGLVVGTYMGLNTVDHAGGDAGYRSHMTRFPDQHFSVAVLCNLASTNPTNLALKVADVYLARQMKESIQPASALTDMQSTSMTLTEQQLAGLAGLYWSQSDDQFLQVYMKEGDLHASIGGEEDYALRPVSETGFHVVDVPFGDRMELRFEPPLGDRPRRLEKSFPYEEPTVLEFVLPFTPTVAERAEYLGDYLSKEIDPIYRVAVQEERLVLLRPKHKPDALEPRIRDVFSGRMGTIRFTRDSKDRVSGFLLSTGRIRNVRFSRRAG